MNNQKKKQQHEGELENLKIKYKILFDLFQEATIQISTMQKSLETIKLSLEVNEAGLSEVRSAQSSIQNRMIGHELQCKQNAESSVKKSQQGKVIVHLTNFDPKVKNVKNEVSNLFYKFLNLELSTEEAEILCAKENNFTTILV